MVSSCALLPVGILKRDRIIEIMIIRTIRQLAILLILPTLLTGNFVSAKEKLSIIASFSILADIVTEIGGERVSVSALVGPDEDAHVFEPAPYDVERVKTARLIVLNGIGFDGWLERLVRASGSAPPMLIASTGITPLKLADGASPTVIDPHAWQNVANVRVYAENIESALSALDPDGRSIYENNLVRYWKNLDELEHEIRTTIADISIERRKIVTSHDSFAYFEQAYAFKMIAPQGVSTEAEASARDVARIISQIKRDHIPAAFLENVTNPRLINLIAQESGVKIGGRLYSDALSRADGPAGSYILMMRNNIRELKKALTQ